MRSRNNRQAHDSRSSPRNDSNNFSQQQYSRDSSDNYRNIYDDDPRWEGTAQEFINQKMRAAEREISRIRQAREQE